MGLAIQPEGEDIWTLQITGVLTKAEFGTLQTVAAARLGATGHVRVVILAEDFQGWEEGADWSDMTFFVEHGHQLQKIAVVADPKWKEQLLMFLGAGLRSAPVQFFPAGQKADALAWIR